MSTGRYIDAGAILSVWRGAQSNVGFQERLFSSFRRDKAYLEGGEKPKGYTLVKHGLKLLAEAGRWGELYRLGHRTLAVLDEKGFTDEKEQLAAWLEEVLPEDSEQAMGLKSQITAKHPVLPTACPSCGGPVDPSIVSWRDEVTAECIFCGSMVRAEP